MIRLSNITISFISIFVVDDINQYNTIQYNNIPYHTIPVRTGSTVCSHTHIHTHTNTHNSTYLKKLSPYVHARQLLFLFNRIPDSCMILLTILNHPTVYTVQHFCSIQKHRSVPQNCSIVFDVHTSSCVRQYNEEDLLGGTFFSCRATVVQGRRPDDRVIIIIIIKMQGSVFGHRARSVQYYCTAAVCRQAAAIDRV